MRILLIKTSSMGDVIYTLPALTDASLAIKNISFDWVVEKPFAEIPAWHPNVKKVIPVELRRWRKNILARDTRLAFGEMCSELIKEPYDLILDAQSLVKSALLTYFARGKRVGLNFRSAREPLASFAYQRKYKVNFYQHAVSRMRSLFSQALGYALPDTGPDFGLAKNTFPAIVTDQPYLVFLHGTTWSSKQWPEEYWISLAKLATRQGCASKSVAEMMRKLRGALELQMLAAMLN